MYIMGDNPMVASPDTTTVEAGLRNLDFLVVQELFMSETARLADVVLPAAAFAEKDGTFTNTERRVQLLRKAVEAPGEARPDWRIVCDSDSLGPSDDIPQHSGHYGRDRLAGAGLRGHPP